MTDATATDKPPVRDTPVAQPNWLATIAAKKISIGVVKFAMSLAATPAAVSIFTTATQALEPYGVKVEVDPAILEKALPGIIFAGLVAAHDYLKLKTNWKWL